LRVVFGSENLAKGPSIRDVPLAGGLITCGQGRGWRTLRTSASWYFSLLFQHALHTLFMDDVY